VWKYIAVVAISIATPPFYTIAADISTTSTTYVEALYASFVVAIYGVAVFALIENESRVYFTTAIALGSEPTETDYGCCCNQYNIHHILCILALNLSPNPTLVEQWEQHFGEAPAKPRILGAIISRFSGKKSWNSLMLGVPVGNPSRALYYVESEREFQGRKWAVRKGQFYQAE
jgi:hypothetical protein